MYTLTCEICSSEFESSFKDVKICTNCKNRPCEVCGKSFVRSWPYNQRACSDECRAKIFNDSEYIASREVKRKLTIESSKTRMKPMSEVAVPKLIRNCVICGKPFEASGSQSTCTNEHFKECVVCGRDFEFKHISDKRQTCSNECRQLLRKRTVVSTKHICEYCGKEFYSESSTAKYCNDTHYKECVICGKQFEVNLKGGVKIENLPIVCSISCRTQLVKQRWEADPDGRREMIERAVERGKQTCLERYGVPFACQTPENIEKARIQSYENLEFRKQRCIEKYGVPFAAQNPEVKAKISKAIASKSNQLKMQHTMLERYGVKYAMQSADIARSHSENQFCQRACDGTKVDSKWEAVVYNFLVRNGIEFEYNTHSIPFEYDGEEHVTHIDFKIGDMLFEVKGSHLLQGTYSNAPKVVPIEVKLNLYKKNHVVVITDSSCADMFGRPNSNVSNGLKYLNKCPEPLIGVDISLFSDPSFPYKSDRPPCFYDVKVDGALSSLEAFKDEKIRWKMILNRVNYTGGFIDSNQILTAMNVTRTCKQPSWFSKSLATRIIQTYCTSDTIVDSFAGWGMRHDAAKELGRKYIGIDFNPELVSWHQSHHRGIQFGDANTFTYNEECSVFICPPYSDPKTGRCFEDYNFEGFDASAKSLSQCDWLKIVMKNIPNAKEYVMVCKIVDEDFKDNVVETIVNKSHFGSNNEYIILIKNNQTT